MKKAWLTNHADIKSEIDNLIARRIGLIFSRTRTDYKRTRATATVDTDGNNLLILKLPEDFTDLGRKALCYYHLPGKPLRGFQCIPAKKTDALLGVQFPDEIFEIQRRNYPRVPTPNQSSATFSIKGRMKIYHAYLVDFCSNGAKIKGDFPNIFSKDDVLTPLSLTLFLRFKRNQETIIQIPEAIVAWSAGNDDNSEMGIRFKNIHDEQQMINEYIDLRTIEDESFTSLE